jgi:hypothetical protein
LEIVQPMVVFLMMVWDAFDGVEALDFGDL